MARTVAFAAALLLLALAPGCAATRPSSPGEVTEDAPDEDQLQALRAEAAAYRRKGSGSVNGRVAVTTAAGAVDAGSGIRVFVAPATAWAVARFERFVVAGNRVPPSFRAAVQWQTTTDAEGRFAVTSLPGGSYLVASEMFWTPAGAQQPRAEVPYARFDLLEGGSADVVATRVVD